MTAEWLFIRDFSKINFGEETNLLARTWHEGNLLPGYVNSNRRVAFFSHEGQVVTKDSEFEIFKGGSHIGWKPHRIGHDLHSKAFQVGKTVRNQPLYACRVIINGTFIYGQVCGNDVHIISKNEKTPELQAIDLLVLK
ncbi:Hypothetical predicted protein [Cloeon dipterum]|uniref:Uncharacterized protein n=1 Tax=Cloeon dipterum TaxID=197152 RepID=A0A8S1E0E0_9INSE|nr:Hypothetical predicted protein [Cloeon dipterum]